MSDTRGAATPSGEEFIDVAVLGGGLAGLASAAYAARAGADVMLLEKSASLGGRAATHCSQGFSFNVGPHALYAGCEAEEVLRELGVPFSGRRPPVSGGLAFRGGRVHTLPSGFLSLLTTGLLSLPGKLELARTLGSLPKLACDPLRRVSLREWLDASFRDKGVREFVEALARLTGYANDPERASAGAAIAQMQRGLTRGVHYLDSGWQSLVEGLTRSAVRAGVRIEVGQRPSAVRQERDGTYTIQRPSGPNVHAAAVVIAAAPSGASLYRGPGSDALARRLAVLRPVKAACLDLALRRLPDPRVLFCLGVDRPLYFSVHSASARLAPAGCALVHVAKYLPSRDAGSAFETVEREAGVNATDPAADRAELESFCDLLQPGWRNEVVERRYLPSMTVVHALVEARDDRPPVRVEGSEGLWLAGDWLGSEGMLADAALASARRAGSAAAAHALRRSAQEMRRTA